MSINLITGRPGSGKTFCATQLILHYLSYGHDVYTNIDLKFEGKIAHLAPGYNRVHRREEILLLRKGIIILDEGQIWFNSRNWAAMSEDMQMKFQQHRHDDLHVWILTQNAKRIDLVVRELIVRYARTTKLWGIRVPWAKDSRYFFRSPLLPSMGLGIEADPDYARFVMEFFDIDDLTVDLRPRIMADGEGNFKEVEPLKRKKFLLTPFRKGIFDTHQSQTN